MLANYLRRKLFEESEQASRRFTVCIVCILFVPTMVAIWFLTRDTIQVTKLLVFVLVSFVIGVLGGYGYWYLAIEPIRQSLGSRD